MDKFLIPRRFSGVLQGTIRIGRSLLLLGHAGAGGVSAAIVVSMDQIVMVAAQVLAAVAAELCGRLTAPFLMLLQLVRTPESANVADFYLLTRLQSRIQGDTWIRNRFDDGWMLGLCPGASMSLAFCMRLLFGTSFRF